MSFTQNRSDLYPFELQVRSKATRKLVSVYHYRTRKEAVQAAKGWRASGAYTAKVVTR